MKPASQPLSQPFPSKVVFQVMAVAIVILALLAGYYYTLYTNQVQFVKTESQLP